ncbi:hypothetical protein AB0N31_26780 [Streptomyces sp. NPDC051051]|uniref:hypothetical protein n=1 Tax=Streptomyces sp. NPDC051051 TaxID=3155666 RepID=UPI00342A2FCB
MARPQTRRALPTYRYGCLAGEPTHGAARRRSRGVGAHDHALQTAALLGERVAWLVRRPPWHGAAAADDDLAVLRQADEDGRAAGFDAGVLEDWRTVLELVAARTSPLRAVDRHKAASRRPPHSWGGRPTRH